MESVKNKIRRKIGDAFNSRRRSDERALSASDIEIGEWTSLPAGNIKRNSVAISNIDETENVVESDLHTTTDGGDINDQFLAIESGRTADKGKKSKQERKRKKKKEKRKFKHASDVQETTCLDKSNSECGFPGAVANSRHMVKTNVNLKEEITQTCSSVDKKAAKVEEKRMRKLKRKVKQNHHTGSLFDPSSEVEQQKKKKKRKKKKKTSKEDETKVNGDIDFPDNTSTNKGNQLVLPDEKFTSRIFSWLESSKFSDTSDTELNKKRKQSRKQKKKRENKHRTHRQKQNDDNEADEVIIARPETPSLLECKEEYCQRYKCIGDYEIQSPDEIMVFNFLSDAGRSINTNISTEINNKHDETKGSSKFENRSKQNNNDLHVMNIGSVGGESEAEINHEKGIPSTKYKRNDDLGSSETRRLSTKRPNEKTIGTKPHQTVENSSLSTDNTKGIWSLCKNVAPVTMACDLRDLKQERRSIEDMLHRVDLFNGIVLEEELKQQIYQKKGKQEVEAQFTQMLDAMVRIVIDKHREFKAELDRAHDANMEKLDKEKRVCKKVRTGVLSMMETSQQDGASSTYREANLSEEKRNEKCDVYEEILWRSYNSAYRFDYETVLHPEIGSLFCTTESQQVDAFGEVRHWKQEVCRPIKLIDSGEVSIPIIDVNDTLFFSIKHEQDEGVCNVTGCAFLSDGKCVIADNENWSLKLINIDNVIITRKLLENKPWDVCFVSADQIAVSVPDANTIRLVQYTNNELRDISSFNTGSPCYGLASVNRNILVTCHSPDGTAAVQSFSKEGQLLLNFRNDHTGSPLFYFPEYICTSKDESLIYVSDSGSHSVLGFTPTGCLVFRYKHDALIHPTYIRSLDDRSFVVCGKDSNNVQIVSDAGEFIQTFVENCDEAQAIDIDIDRHRFILASSNSDAIISAKLVTEQSEIK